jgi:hypothetical protein
MNQGTAFWTQILLLRKHHLRYAMVIITEEADVPFTAALCSDDWKSIDQEVFFFEMDPSLSLEHTLGISGDGFFR